LMFGGVNIGLIAEQELTLVDAGLPGSTPRVVELVRRLGRSVDEITTVVITHNHFDHIAGLPDLLKLTEVKVIAHAAGLVGADAYAPYPEGIRRMLRVPFLNPLRRRFVLGESDVDVQLTGGEVLNLLGGLQVIHTPGHTPGSICLYSPQRRLVFVGDAMRRHRRSLELPAKPVSTDLVQAVDSLRKIAELDFDVMVFGHGRPVTEEGRAWVQALLRRAGG